jgi:hypothetical protein
MTAGEALTVFRRVGTVEIRDGKLKLSFPESARDALQSAIDALRTSKAEAIALLTQLGPAELSRASGVLNQAGVRIIALECGATIGVWSDLDGPEVRAALRTFGSERLPVRYLDGAGVPMRYKVRRVDGEPVPMNVLAAMEQHPAEPWTVRDRMLNEMGWCAEGILWAEWKAAALNRLFKSKA